MKSKAEEVIRLNSRAAALGATAVTQHKKRDASMLSNGSDGSAGKRKKKTSQQEELKSKVNKLFDMRASDALIINRLKRNDSVFDKIQVNENYFHSPTAKEGVAIKEADV